VPAQAPPVRVKTRQHSSFPSALVLTSNGPAGRRSSRAAATKRVKYTDGDDEEEEATDGAGAEPWGNERRPEDADDPDARGVAKAAAAAPLPTKAKDATPKAKAAASPSKGKRKLVVDSDVEEQEEEEEEEEAPAVARKRGSTDSAKR
jgi:hypothetical protein